MGGIRCYADRGVNFDCCRLAVEFEERQRGLRPLWTKRNTLDKLLELRPSRVSRVLKA